MNRVYFHVDMDAFFASVEQLDNPGLKGRPVVVGAQPGTRGVVSTCSYEARAFGVHSAMPIGEACRLCPQAAFVPVRMKRYAAVSKNVMEIFERFTPEVRRVSIDEAFLDMTGTERLWGSPLEAAKAIKAAVRAETELSISVGIAPTPYLAKIASGLKKPDGLVIVEPGEEAEFMLALPIGKLWGAGQKTQDRFRELGISTMAQLASISEHNLEALFGKAGGHFLFEASRGRGHGLMEARAEARSLSSETTFEWDIIDRDELEGVLLGLSDEICYRLWNEGLSSRCLFLKMRLGDFSTLSRRRTRSVPYLDTGSAYADARGLLDSAWNGTAPIRLLGLGFGELEPASAPRQGELFPEGDDKARRADAAVFEIERSGLGDVKRARLLGDRAAGSGVKRRDRAHGAGGDEEA
jgi:DNA polymerase-4